MAGGFHGSGIVVIGHCRESEHDKHGERGFARLDSTCNVRPEAFWGLTEGHRGQKA